MDERDVRELRQLIDARRRDRFGEGFAGRALAHWQASRGRGATLDTLLVHQFWRLVPLAAAAAILFAAYNLAHVERDSRQSVVSAMLGLGDTSIPSLESLYGLEN